jgi:hypothetical protein
MRARCWADSRGRYTGIDTLRAGRIGEWKQWNKMEPPPERRDRRRG